MVNKDMRDGIEDAELLDVSYQGRIETTDVPINWQQKLSSRKFWVALLAVLAAVLAAFGLGEGTVERISAIVGAFGTLIVFILTEGAIDVAREKSNVTIEQIDTDGGMMHSVAETELIEKALDHYAATQLSADDGESWPEEANDE